MENNVNNQSLIQAKQLTDNSIRVIKLVAENIKTTREINQINANSVNLQTNELGIRACKQFEACVASVYTNLQASLNEASALCRKTVLNAVAEFDGVLKQEIDRIIALYEAFESRFGKPDFNADEEMKLVKISTKNATENCVKALRLLNETVIAANKQKHQDSIEAYRVAKLNYGNLVSGYFDDRIKFLEAGQSQLQGLLLFSSNELSE